MSKLASTLGTLLAGLIGAAATGGATATYQYVQTNGATQDLGAVGSAAAAGAVVGILGYFVKSPAQP